MHQKYFISFGACLFTAAVVLCGELAADEPASSARTITNADILGFHRRIADELKALAPEKEKPPGPRISIAVAPPIRFRDATLAIIGHSDSYQTQLTPGLDYWRARSDKHFMMDLAGAQGLAVGDANGDHLDDVYILQPGGLPNRLFIHQNDGTAIDQSNAFNVDILDCGRNGLFVDLDNDGDQDLVVALNWQILIIANAGKGRFQPGTMLWSKGRITSVSSADFDNDGDLDLYSCARDSSSEVWAEEGLLAQGIPTPHKDANNGGRNTLWSNVSEKGEATSGWKFEDVTKQVGLDVHNRRFSMSAAWEDYDNDGDQDLYVVNDFGRNNLYRNENGIFADVAAQAGVEDIGLGTSTAWSDMNGDGWADLYAANRNALGSSRFLNNGDGTFRDHIPGWPGATEQSWEWGSNFDDLDNDGDHDLVVANGLITAAGTGDVASEAWKRITSQSPANPGDIRSVFAYRKPWTVLNALVEEGKSYSGFESNRAYGSFASGRLSDFSAVSGLDFKDDSRAIAVVDWDHDGRQDYWISNRSAPRIRFMHNRSETETHFISFKLEGTRCNRDAIGARVKVRVDDRSLSRTLRAGDGGLGQGSKWLHFGLRNAKKIDKLEVRWPGGKVEPISIKELAIDKFYFVVQGSGSLRRWTPPDYNLANLPQPVLASPPRSDQTRIAFLSRLPLPEIEYETFDGRRRPLVTADRKRRLIYLWANWDEPSLAGLKELSEATGLREQELEIVALSVDRLVQTTPETKSLDEIAKTLTEMEWPYASGMATKDLQLVLEVIGRALIAKHEPFPIPTSLLLDAKGRVAAIFKGPILVEQLRNDLALLDASWNKISRAAVHFPGQWVRGPWPADPSLVVKNFVAASQPERAERYLKRFKAATTDDQNLADAYYLLADFHRSEKNLEKAISLYEKALAIDEKRSRVHLDLGMVLLGLGNEAAAAQHFRKAARDYPEDSMLRGWLDRAP